MGFKSIDQPGRSSEVECNPKMSILFFWLERGGRRGLSPLTSPADHQKLNVIQKQAFNFLPGEGWQMGFESINQPSWSSKVERNPKMSILFFWLERGSGRGLSPLTSPVDHQKLNVIQKEAFYFFGWRGVADWSSSPLTRPADHQKLNIIEKWAFYFFGWRGVTDRVRVHWPAWSIIRSWT